ncbi:MAG: prepilin-type N-terminal cleavage/methylation domain-containing protein [Nitrospiraceae bacterium]|nr:prepilin-type N-terminal cleavage/methylation domain-containing protein [Nitrospiraceae bacterium]
MTSRRRYTGSARTAGDGGFTLLELLISFAILGLIAVILAAALKVGVQAVSKGERKMNSVDRVRTSLTIVEAQIQSETGLTYDDNGEQKRYFRGGNDALQLSTNYSIWGGSRGYVVVSYSVETDNEGKQSLKAAENVIGMDNPRETTLFTAMDRISFEYFYKGPTDEKGSWVESWTDDLTVPVKVKLRLVSGERDYSLIIPMRTATAQNSAAPPPFSNSQRGGSTGPFSDVK